MKPYSSIEGIKYKKGEGKWKKNPAGSGFLKKFLGGSLCLTPTFIQAYMDDPVQS